MSITTYLLPFLGIGVDLHLHNLSNQLAERHHKETEHIGIIELITTTLATKLETHRDACEEKLKKYSNCLLMSGILIGILGQLLPSTLPEHHKYIVGTYIPLIQLYYFFLANTFGCLIICFISCSRILHDISYYMTNLNKLWSDIETTCITKLHKNQYQEIQNILACTYYTICDTTHIVDLEGWFNYDCRKLHTIIISSSSIGFVSFIISFILSLEAILVPITVHKSSKSYAAFYIVMITILTEMIGLYIYMVYRNITKKQIQWYSSNTGNIVHFTNPITVHVTL